MQHLTNDVIQWDLTPFFPAFEGPDYLLFRQTLRDHTAALLQRANTLGPLSLASLDAWESLLLDLETAEQRVQHLSSYLGCLTATDARDEARQRAQASLEEEYAHFQKIAARLQATLRDADESSFQALLAKPSLACASYHLQRQRQLGLTAMPVEQENLAADLLVHALSAWGRLYRTVTGGLDFPLDLPDQPPQRVPLSQTRSLLEDPSPTVREAALQGSNAELQRLQEVFAASLNAICGARLTLWKHRRIPHFLDAPLFQARIRRQTLDAMHAAIAARRDLPRQYLRAKAKLLGKPRLAFSDLMAPLPLPAPSTVPWPQAKQRVLDAFHAHHPDLGDFARMAFDQQWIDASPGPGRSPGGFCTSSTLIRQSRVFMTYKDTLGDLQTLAHELGHAFHNWAMRDLRHWGRAYSMTLAETASTYAEAVLTDAVLHHPDASDQDRAVILDTRLERAASFLLNIPMRFLFEEALYQERPQGPLSVSRLHHLMLDAQRQTYGDTLDEDHMDPWFWASKMHFYLPHVAFYNFPYAFGYLFSMGVFQRAQQEGPAFFPKYIHLLRMTGSANAEDIAQQCLGVDLSTPDFWLETIDLIQQDLDAYLDILPRVLPAS